MENKCNSIECLNQNKCSGCGACSNKCPFNAITMQYDSEGFIYPVIDKEKCTNCGACKLVCPALNPSFPNEKEPKVYAAWAEDAIRMSCSSGGIFSVLASKILSRDGYVCGAAMNKDMEVEHIIVDSMEGLECIKESKYIPSKTGDIYKQIEKLLKDGKEVIFGGCPCQAAGLRQYLKKEYDKLYIVDVLCTGGISHLVWEKYLNEFHRGKPIHQLKFRDKSVYGWVHGMHIRFKDGTVYYGPKELDPFYKIFMKKLAFRESCGQCQYANASRQGDITLGDFWGIRQFDKKLDDGKGTSIVTINNEKGLRLFEQIKNELKEVQEVPLSFLMKRGQPFQAPKKPHPKRERFMSLLSRYSLEKAYKYTLEDRYDIGVFGVWWGSNYGSMMTYYSLVKLLQSYGLSTIMVDRPGFKPDNPLFSTHARKFAKSHFEAISEVYSFDELWKLNHICDAFIMGSDQVWNFGISEAYKYNFFLAFADDEKKKISYAASFGHDKYKAPRDAVDTHRELLSKFDAISVREQSGVEILENTFGIKGTRVLDPVFMVERDVYDKVMSESEKKVEEPFIATYILDPTPEKREALLYVAKQKGLKLINILDGFRTKLEANKKKMELEVDEDVEVQDWLYYISHCEYFITDSCHGASFAIIYEKPFVCIGNTTRGLTRFESLFQLLRLEKRLVLDASEILKRPDLLEPIEYKPVMDILEKERERSKNWLEEALFSTKIGDSTRFYPYIDSRLEARRESEIKILHPLKNASKVLYNRALIFYKENIQTHISDKLDQKLKEILER